MGGPIGSLAPTTFAGCLKLAKLAHLYPMDMTQRGESDGCELLGHDIYSYHALNADIWKDEIPSCPQDRYG